MCTLPPGLMSNGSGISSGPAILMSATSNSCGGAPVRSFSATPGRFSVGLRFARSTTITAIAVFPGSSFNPSFSTPAAIVITSKSFFTVDALGAATTAAHQHQHGKSVVPQPMRLGRKRPRPELIPTDVRSMGEDRERRRPRPRRRHGLRLPRPAANRHLHPCPSDPQRPLPDAGDRLHL